MSTTPPTVPPTQFPFLVLDHETGKFLEHRQLCRDPNHKPTWDRSYENEIGCLCQGVGTHPKKQNIQRVAVTNTMRPIRFSDIPKDCISDVAHTKVVYEVRLTKVDPNRTRITIGGNTITYLGDCRTRTGSLKLSILSSTAPYLPPTQDSCPWTSQISTS